MKKIKNLLISQTAVLTVLFSNAAHADSLLQGLGVQHVEFSAFVDMIVLSGLALFTVLGVFGG